MNNLPFFVPPIPLNRNNHIVPMMNCCSEKSKRINSLEAENQLLTSRVKELEAELGKLKKNHLREKKSLKSMMELLTKPSGERNGEKRPEMVPASASQDDKEIALAFWKCSKGMKYSGKKRKLCEFVKKVFKGEVKDDLEREVVKKKRFDAIAMAKSIDIGRGNLNLSAVDHMRTFEEGIKKHGRGIIPSGSTVGHKQKFILDKACEDLGGGLAEDDSRVHVVGGKNKTAIKFLMDFGYVDLKGTREEPIKVKIACDGTPFGNSHSGFMGAFVNVDPRLKSKERAGEYKPQSHENVVPFVFAAKKDKDVSREKYIEPALKDLMNAATERKIVCDDGKNLEVNLDVAFVGDMAENWQCQGCGHGTGSAAGGPYFCNHCPCSNGTRARGQVGGCSVCKEENRDLSECCHWDLNTPEVREQRKNLLSRMRTEVGEIPLTVLPVCETKADFENECRKRQISFRSTNSTIPELEGKLRIYCNSLQPNDVELADISAVRADLKKRDMVLDLKDEELRGSLANRLQKELDLIDLEVECKCEHFDYEKTKSLIQDPERLILCILHGENRMTEKILTRLFQWQMTNGKGNKNQRKKRVKEAEGHIHEYALNGSTWSVDFDETKPDKVKDIKLSKAHCRYIFNQKAWDDGHVQKLIDILVDARDKNKGHIVKHVEMYVSCMHAMAKERPTERSEIIKFQDKADICCKEMMAVWGMTSITNYFHCLMAGHFRNLMLRWGDLLIWSNEGVEAFNAVMKEKYFKGTQKGGSIGTHGKSSSKALGIGNWFMRRWYWSCGKGDAAWEKKKEDNADETSSEEEEEN